MHSRKVLNQIAGGIFMFKSKLGIAVFSALVVAFLPGAAVAQDEWSASGNVALTSDYKFRGISQSDESPAIQGGFDLEHDSGFYAGVWGSSVDFNPSGEDYDGSLELDLYLGIGGDLGDSGLTWDLGYIYYDYPGDDGKKGDYQELYAGLGWKDLSLGLAHSDDYYGKTGKFWYLYGDYSLALGMDVSLDFHIGFNRLDEKNGFLMDQDAYTDYSISVSRDFAGVNIALTYVGTDLDEAEVFDTDWGEGIIHLALSKSL